jgi:hypothetical protein
MRKSNLPLPLDENNKKKQQTTLQQQLKTKKS